MKKKLLFIKILFISLLVLIFINTNAQNGLNFQGVARSSNNVILASQDITIKLSILQGSATGIPEYIETRKVKTNAQGLFTAVIGDAETLSTSGNFSDIDWKLTPKFLKIEIDPAAGNNFTTMGTTQFQFVAYAKYANSVLADNIIGVVPVAKGGTGATSLPNLKTALALDKVNNTADSLKPISKSTQAALDLKLNMVDSTKAYVTPAQLSKYNFSSGGTSVDTTTLYNRVNTKLNISDTSSLLRKTDTTTLYNRVNTKLNISDTSFLLRKTDTASLSNRINLKLNISDTSSLLRKSDTTSLLRKIDTATLSNRINFKLNISDTTSLLRKTDTATLSNRVNLKLNISDTTSLLRKTDTASLSNRVNLKLNISDTSSLLRKTDTASLSNRVNLKLNISDTSGLLRKTDTASLSNRVNLKLNIADTSILLRKTDTASLSNRVNLKLNIADTTILLRKTDTANLSNRINLKLNISDTSSLLRKTQLGSINGAASLDAAGKIPSVQIPAISFSSVDVVNSQAAMLSFTSGTGLTTDRLIGSIVVRIDSSKNFVLANLPASNRANWIELVNPDAPVKTVNGLTGYVNLKKSDIPDLTSVDNTSDEAKPLSLASRTALNLKLNITDTSNLLKKSDTSFLLQKVDTTAILAMYAKKFTKDVVLNGVSNIGKYTNGQTIPAKGKTLDEFLYDIATTLIHPSYSSPSVSINASPSFGQYEIGYNLGLVVLSYNYNKNDGGDVTSVSFNKGGTPLGTGVYVNSADTIKTAISYGVSVNYAAGTTVKNNNLGNPDPVGQITAGATSASSGYSIYSKRYWGGISAPFNSTTIYDIKDVSPTPTSDNSGGSKSITTNITISGTQYAFYAYPATNADLTSIMYNNFESINTFTKTIVQIKNAQGYTQNYKVYTSNDPISATLTSIAFN